MTASRWTRRLPRAAGALGLVLALGTQAYAGTGGEVDLVIEKGCIACHGVTELSVGPRFSDVAKRYGGSSGAAEALAQHIKNGTGPAGVGWLAEGKASMPFMFPSRTLSVPDAQRIARWILATKGEMPGLDRYVSERFRLWGSVKTGLSLGLSDLRSWPVRDLREIDVVMETLATAPKTERLKGVPLRTLLEKAVIVSPDQDMRKIIVIAKSASGQFAIFSWVDIFNSPTSDGVLVFFERNGKPLADDEGGIALISGKDNHMSCRHVRWLTGIEVRHVAE